MIKQFFQICFNSFFTTILHLFFCLVLIEGKFLETHRKILYSNFPVVQYFLLYLYRFLVSLLCLVEMLQLIRDPKRKTKPATQSATGTSIIYLPMTIPNYFF